MTDNVRIETSCIRNSRNRLVRHLVIDDVIWMSADDIEYKDISRAIQHAHGNCFVGGLGLGTIVEELSNKKEVDTITVVEINDNIIDLTCNYLGGFEKWHDGRMVSKDGKIHIHLGDATKDFHAVAGVYDYAYFDIWLEPDQQAKDTMELCFKNIKPYMKENGILEAWLKPRLESNDLWN